MSRVFNKSEEREKRRRLRRNVPKAEAVVWSRLKGKQLLGYKFRRQYSVGPYVLDFYCPALKLAVEVDGNSHYKISAQPGDQIRQAYVESFGTGFIRFTNEEVYQELENVLAAIARVAHGERGATPL